MKYFLKQLFTKRSQNMANMSRPFALVMDKRPQSMLVHKTLNFYKSSKLKFLTISPYSPSLNPLEKLVGAVKTNLLKEQDKGRYNYRFKFQLRIDCWIFDHFRGSLIRLQLQILQIHKCIQKELAMAMRSYIFNLLHIALFSLYY